LFQVDYSDQIKAMSITSSDTTITLTDLKPGINYFINVTAITDTSEIVTTSTTVVTSM